MKSKFSAWVNMPNGFYSLGISFILSVIFLSILLVAWVLTHSQSGLTFSSDELKVFLHNLQSLRLFEVTTLLLSLSLVFYGLKGLDMLGRYEPSKGDNSASLIQFLRNKPSHSHNLGMDYEFAKNPHQDLKLCVILDPHTDKSEVRKFLPTSIKTRKLHYSFLPEEDPLSQEQVSRILQDADISLLIYKDASEWIKISAEYHYAVALKKPIVIQAKKNVELPKETRPSPPTPGSKVLEFNTAEDIKNNLESYFQERKLVNGSED